MGNFFKTKLTKPVQVAVIFILVVMTYFWVVLSRSPEMCEVSAIRGVNTETGGKPGSVPDETDRRFDVKHQAEKETFWTYTYFVSLAGGEAGIEVTTEKAFCYVVGQRVTDP